MKTAVLTRLVIAASAAIAAGGCSTSDQGGTDSAQGRDAKVAQDPSVIADTLSAECPVSGRRGSVLVPRPQPDDESGVTFKLLGDGAGPGVVLCRDVLYADAASLLDLMGESGRITVSGGRALIDSMPSQIPAYLHSGVTYVAVAPFARQRRALLVQGVEHRMDATIWPQATLLYMQAAGNTQGAAYQAAVREGLVPNR